MLQSDTYEMTVGTATVFFKFMSYGDGSDITIPSQTTDSFIVQFNSTGLTLGQSSYIYKSCFSTGVNFRTTGKFNSKTGPGHKVSVPIGKSCII